MYETQCFAEFGKVRAPLRMMVFLAEHAYMLLASRFSFLSNQGRWVFSINVSTVRGKGSQDE